MNQKARDLRKNQTDAEQIIWMLLRNRQLLNKKFRRQHAIGPYIVDFICIENSLIIELDGGQHLEQASYDEQRTVYLESKGYKVIRFWNHEVLTNTEAVLSVIYDALEEKI